ncbi:MAG: nucleotide exchange factor GrpE [Clostridia bacterium]
MSDKNKDSKKNGSFEEEVIEIFDDIDEKVDIKEDVNESENMSLDQCKERVSELEAENEKLKNQFQRSLADYANLKLRSERERLSLLKTSNADFIRKLLPIIDNFERAIKAKDDDSKSVGISMIYKQLHSVLEEQGLEKIEAEGEHFDPSMHDALMMEETNEYDDGIVIEVFEPGYVFKDKLIRTAKVKVSSNKEDL